MLFFYKEYYVLWYIVVLYVYNIRITDYCHNNNNNNNSSLRQGRAYFSFKHFNNDLKRFCIVLNGWFLHPVLNLITLVHHDFTTLWQEQIKKISEDLSLCFSLLFVCCSLSTLLAPQKGGHAIKISL